MASNVLQLTDFEALIDSDKLEFAEKTTKFKTNGERIGIRAPGDKILKVQLATGRSDALKMPFGCGQYAPKDGVPAPDAKWTVTFAIPVGSANHRIWGEKIQRKLEEQGEKHKADWFAGLPPKKRADPVRELHSVLADPKVDEKTGTVKYPEFTMKVNVRPDKLTVYVVEKGKLRKIEHEPHKAIPKMAWGVPIVEIPHGWCAASGWGISLSLSSLIVYPGESSGPATFSDFQLSEDIEMAQDDEQPPAEKCAPALDQMPGACALACDMAAPMDVEVETM